MSDTANWSYEHEITVKPFVSMDQRTKVKNYGTEYVVKCNVIGVSEQHRDANGQEFVSRHVIYLEDPRPKFLDMVYIAEADSWQEIRAKTYWDMDMFEETPDYKLVT